MHTKVNTMCHNVAKKKSRLDRLLVERGLAETRNKAQALIGAGQIRVDGKLVDKAGQNVPIHAELEILTPGISFVGRGGVKLEHGLDYFGIDVGGLVCMDVGASTGGFTDCLLQRGAKRVYAVDVGYGQLDWRLRNDPRVVVMERTNIRSLPPNSLPEKIKLVTIDTSFISLKIVVPAAILHMAETGMIIALIKPQFEVGKGLVGKGGIVRDPAMHKRVIEDLEAFFRDKVGLVVCGVTPSPIYGAKGNKEFLIYLKRNY